MFIVPMSYKTYSSPGGVVYLKHVIQVPNNTHPTQKKKEKEYSITFGKKEDTNFLFLLRNT